MKRIVSLLLCLLLVVALPACKKDKGSTDTTESTAQAATPQSPTQASGTTLMIYMVGSDLEAKGGAGTKDMEEIIASGVDLSCNNVLVYAGGAKKWHNDTLAETTGHSILRLTAEGFQTLETRDEASMGDAATLSYFLNYAHSNYAAPQYALILWDHGNGPLIGYGKDMLHEDDSLTLLEMQTALQASPFNDSNKLSWVGFDACLMSSVELACIWQPYAEYMIASQEIEPSFGWNYAFLQQLGKVDTVSLSSQVTQQYMSACLDYYQRRNFDQRDTTLACMDLSKLAPLKTALEALFTKANADVSTAYSQLVATRVETRALGRASTGSEYDLIDLVDMAEKMKAHYPAEAETVKQAAQALVIQNTTNAENCCGISLYYPFYNKSYYEKTWGDVYSKLNVLPAYTTYLQSYAQRWLQNDLMQSVASSTTPKATSSTQFTLNLTDAQAANYAEATYYILQREGDQIYTRIYTSSGVNKNGNVLTATFDGNILYAKNKFDQYWIPAVDEHDTVGNYTRLSTYLNLTNNLPLYDQKPEGYQHAVAGHRFHISVNNTTGQISTSALVPYDTKVQTDTLIGGKLEDADLSAWSEYYFLQERHLYLQRDENGTVLPLDKWVVSDYLSASVSRVGDGIEFTMAPIPAGEYYLIFEVEDVQGNRYCSELLPIQSQGADLPVSFQQTPAQVNWESGSKVQLFQQEGITAYLTTTQNYDSVSYALEIQNSNNFDVAILGHQLFFNNTVDCSDGFFAYYAVPAGKTVVGNAFDFGVAQDLEMLKDMRSIEFSLSVVTISGDRTLIFRKPIYVNLSAYAAGLRTDPPADSYFNSSYYYKTTAPAYSLYAKEQVLFQNDGLKAVLLGLGSDGSSDRLVLNFRFENTSNQYKHFAISGLSFDNVFVSERTGTISVAPGTILYKTYVLDDSDMALYQITSASSVKITFSHTQTDILLGGFAEMREYNISLSSRGSKVNFQQGSTLLYQDSSVKIYLQKAEAGAYGGYVWTCTMVNTGSQDLLLGSTDVTLNGKVYANDSMNNPTLTPYDTRCPAGQVTAFTVKYTGSETGALNLTFTPQFYNFAGEQLLYNGATIALNN